MPRNWIIAPYEAKPRDQFDKVWQYDLTNNLISIGWESLGDVSKMSRPELAKAFAATYPERPPGAKGLITKMVWQFYREISPGDFVIARRGRKAFVVVGKVSQSAVYSPGKSPFSGHPHFLEVLWQEQPRNKDFSAIVFQRYTVAEVSEEKFRDILQGPVGVSPPPEPLESIDTNEFVLEKYLEDFIVSNFEAIFKGDMKIYEDTEGNDGQQYDTEVGPIDILAN